MLPTQSVLDLYSGAGTVQLIVNGVVKGSGVLTCDATAAYGAAACTAPVTALPTGACTSASGSGVVKVCVVLSDGEVLSFYVWASPRPERVSLAIPVSLT